jgi:hypothetical protein
MYWASEGLRLPGLKGKYCGEQIHLSEVPINRSFVQWLGQQTPNLLMGVRFPHDLQYVSAPHEGASPIVGSAVKREGKRGVSGE